MNAIYSDEPWVYTGTIDKKASKNKALKKSQQDFPVGFSTGLKPPTDRDPYFALVHTGNKNRFLTIAQLNFLSKEYRSSTLRNQWRDL
jgi:hypothetical protein